MSRYEELTKLIAGVQAVETKYLLHGDRHDVNVTPWMPYQPADFIAIVWECLQYTQGDVFLDVGCGPGTKMHLAHDLFGFEAFGVEIDEDMAQEAALSFPMRVIPGDALTLDIDYSLYDLIWLYRPFRDRQLEMGLEMKITHQMKPGAVIAGGSWELDIPGLGWETVVDDTLNDPRSEACIWRGAWQKPKTIPTS